MTAGRAVITAVAVYSQLESIFFQFIAVNKLLLTIFEEVAGNVFLHLMNVHHI
jgi:hypothetical protein